MCTYTDLFLRCGTTRYAYLAPVAVAVAVVVAVGVAVASLPSAVSCLLALRLSTIQSFVHITQQHEQMPPLRLYSTGLYSAGALRLLGWGHHTLSGWPKAGRRKGSQLELFAGTQWKQRRKSVRPVAQVL